MNAWADRMQIQNVKMIRDGSGNHKIYGYANWKTHLGSRKQKLRYMAVVKDGVVEKWWQEPWHKQ